MDIYLTQGLHRAVQQRPQATATLCAERRQDWRTLEGRVARLAAVLHAHGLQAGERVAVLAHNSDHCAEAFLAAWWAGLAMVPLNTRWSATELLHALRDCDSRLLLADAAFADQAQSLAPQVAGLRALLYLGDGPAPSGMARTEDAMARATPLADQRRGGEALATILYTGGTTGAPKGVMLSHANLWAAVVARLVEMPNPGYTGLLTTPLFHVAGLARMVAQMTLGVTSVIEAQFRPDACLQAIERHGVNDVVLVPSMLQMLLDHPAFDAGRLRSLKRIAHGAAPMPRPLLLRAMQALPWVDFVAAYGMTENAAGVSTSGPIRWATHERHAAILSSVGRAGLACELRITAPGGRALPAGQVGEICMRGPGVMQGYWRRPEETAHVLRGGWLHTGDGGWVDEDGYLFLADRIKDMIISGGENVYSIEVEAVLMQHPDVAQCAVIGVPHAQWGEAVHAVVVPRPGRSPGLQSLRAHCRAQLAGYKCPASMELADALPLSPTGKVLKNRLRARTAAGDVIRETSP